MSERILAQHSQSAQGETLDVMWEPIPPPGLEHLRLTIGPTEIIAASMIIGVWDDAPFHLRYEIRCDEQWRMRELQCEMLSTTFAQFPTASLHLLSDGEGHWTNATDEPQPVFDGCIDVDIMATPFTNTLPIRRLKLAQGESQQLAMVYVALPDLAVSRMEQRYTCVKHSGKAGDFTGRYRYESVASGYTALLDVEGMGLVTTYPDLYAWVWP